MGGERKGGKGEGKGRERREERGRKGEGKREGDAPLTHIPGSAREFQSVRLGCTKRSLFVS